MREEGLDAFAFQNQGLDAALPGYPKHQTLVDGPAKVIELGKVFTLWRTSTQLGDERGKLAVCAAGRRQQDEPCIVGVIDAKFGADDELYAVFLGRHVRLDHTRKRALIGYGDSLVAELSGTLDEFLGVRGRPQETVIAQDMQLGEAWLFLWFKRRLKRRLRRGLRQSSHVKTNVRSGRRRPSTGHRCDVR